MSRILPSSSPLACSLLNFRLLVSTTIGCFKSTKKMLGCFLLSQILEWLKFLIILTCFLGSRLFCFYNLLSVLQLGFRKLEIPAPTGFSVWDGDDIYDSLSSCLLVMCIHHLAHFLSCHLILTLIRCCHICIYAHYASTNLFHVP